MIKIHPEIKTNNDLINKKIQLSNTQQKSGSERVYYIPVVFHVVYDTPNKNIPDNVLINALENLNNNFRKRNNTSSVYPLFQNLAAHCKIEFFLAKKDLDCNSISGITRHQVTKTGFDYSVPADDDELKTYGYMDSKKYFLINLKTLN